MGQNGDRVAACVLKSSSVAWGRKEKRERGPCRCVRVEEGEGGEGGPGTAVGNSGRPAMAPDRRAWVAALLREQGRTTGVANAVDEMRA
jgi:hypothetical protein